jgi:plasmid maintenance system antidote protein VapI
MNLQSKYDLAMIQENEEEKNLYKVIKLAANKHLKNKKLNHEQKREN